VAMQLNSKKKEATAVYWQAGQNEQISERTASKGTPALKKKNRGVATDRSVHTDVPLAHRHFTVLHCTSELHTIDGNPHCTSKLYTTNGNSDFF